MAAQRTEEGAVQPSLSIARSRFILEQTKFTADNRMHLILPVEGLKMDELQRRAEELRDNLTEAEEKVWSQLRAKRFASYKFRRQFVFGGYIVDFICLEKRLIIELDGGQHTLQREYDADRTRYFETVGYHVLRFWNHEVLQDWDTVAETIWNDLQKKL